MAYDAELAQRVREVLDAMDLEVVSERKMFGGLVFMLNGNMCCGVDATKLMLRVGTERYAAALAKPYASLMDLTGRPMRGFVYVSRAGFATPSALQEWVRLAVDFARSLPAK